MIGRSNLHFEPSNYNDSITSQCPPLSGPTRRITPCSFSLLMFLSTPLVVMPRRSAISEIVILGDAEMSSRIFCELFNELFNELSCSVSMGWPEFSSVVRCKSISSCFSCSTFGVPQNPSAILKTYADIFSSTPNFS